MKRFFDVVLVMIAMPVWLPVVLLLMLFIRLKIGSPFFFTQYRTGLHCKPFRLVKFRTMTEARDAQGRLLPDAERLTPFGCWLRRMSLDELPEIWTVLTGEMSLVGPRPLLMEYVPLYTPQQARRHEVRPGITGWAQVNGRNALSWEEKFVLDVWYVENQSFLLDMKILWMTIRRVIKREGISQVGEATTSKFSGSTR